MTTLISPQTNTHNSNNNTYQKLQLMLELGIDKEVIATLLEIANFSIHHIRWFASPIIVYKSSWSETIPPWLITACYRERLSQIYFEHEQNRIENYATKPEVLAYLYPLSLEMPMQSDWSNLYLWLGNEVLTKYKRLKDGQKFWDIVGGYPVEYRQIQHNFEQLAGDIRRSCIAQGKQQGWGKKRTKKEESNQVVNVPKSSNHTNSNNQIIQLSLFN